MGELSVRNLPKFYVVPNQYALMFRDAVFAAYESAAKEYWVPADEDIDSVEDVRELYESFCSLQILNRWNPPVETDNDFSHDDYIWFRECFSENFPHYMEDIRKVFEHFHMVYDFHRKYINMPWKQVW